MAFWILLVCTLISWSVFAVGLVWNIRDDMAESWPKGKVHPADALCVFGYLGGMMTLIALAISAVVKYA